MKHNLLFSGEANVIGFYPVWKCVVNALFVLFESISALFKVDNEQCTKIGLNTVPYMKTIYFKVQGFTSRSLSIQAFYTVIFSCIVCVGPLRVTRIIGGASVLRDSWNEFIKVQSNLCNKFIRMKAENETNRIVTNWKKVD